MKKMYSLQSTAAVALAALGVMAGPANAQKKFGGGGIGGGNPVGILTNKDVQKDLKLSDAQVKTIDDLNTKYSEASKAAFGGGKGKFDKEAFTKLAELGKTVSAEIDKTLNEAQTKRLKELNNQRRGPGLFTSETTAKELGLSDDQKTKIAEIAKDAQSKRGEVFKGLGKDAKAEDREAANKKTAEINKAAIAEIVKTLNADQKSKYESMVGAPFAGVLPPAFGGFGGGGGFIPKKGEPKKVDPKKILED